MSLMDLICLKRTHSVTEASTSQHIRFDQARLSASRHVRESTRNGVSSFLESARSRVEVIVIYTLPAFINFLMVKKTLPNIFEAIMLFVAVSFTAFSVYFFNDIMDYDHDLKNRELGNPVPADRPLGNGTVSKDQMLKYVFVSAFIGLASALLLDVGVFISEVIYLFLGFLYSAEPLRLKRRLMWKNFIIGLGISFSGFSGALTAGGILPINIFWSITCIMITLGGVGLHDLRDMRGDGELGERTVPIVLGPKFTIRLTMVTSMAIILASFVGYYQLDVNLAFPILMTIIMSAWIIQSYPLFKRWNDPIYVDKVVMGRLVRIMLTLTHLVPLIGVYF